MNKILYKLIHKLIYKWLEFRGMNNFISKQYAKELLYDISTKIPLKDKLWSYKHGFLAVDTKFCGITKDNYKDYLTNREYFNAFPLNNIYKKWIDDKLTTRMVLDSFKEYLPKYYFHILENGEILKSIDCPVGYTGTFDDVIHLLQEKKELVFKPNSESGGVGFCKLTYNEGTYSLNSNKVSKKKMIDILMNSNDYVVTEYLHMHKEIKKIN
ncbi:MAG: hypothetical protein KAH05_06260, partial [Clostridiales bacterium]|nr:hypothetical protein [Clostridiales bacterium]